MVNAESVRLKAAGVRWFLDSLSSARVVSVWKADGGKRVSKFLFKLLWEREGEREC